MLIMAHRFWVGLVVDLLARSLWLSVSCSFVVNFLRQLPLSAWPGHDLGAHLVSRGESLLRLDSDAIAIFDIQPAMSEIFKLIH